MYNGNVIKVAKTGISLTLSATSAGAALPTTSSGNAARLVRLASTTSAYVRVGVGAQTAVSTDMLVSANESVILDVTGMSHIAALQAATGGVLNVTPIES